jgi:hypothetical protein
MRHELQMVWIDAATAPAEVIKLLFPWHEPVLIGPRNDMDGYGLTIERHAGIVATSAIS